MLLTNFTYQNKQTGWTLQDLALDRFNLLVGASGVGKTQILRALRSVHLLALRGQAEHALSFSLTFQDKDRSHTWEFESSASAPSLEEASKRSGAPLITVNRERLSDSEEGVLLERDEQKFVFKGQELPQLNRSETALTLLADSSILPVRLALISRILDDRPYSAHERVSEGGIEKVGSSSAMASLEGLRNLINLGAPAKAFMLQERFPEEFDRIKATFIEIFPSVEDVAVERSTLGGMFLEPYEYLRFKLKERGIPHWVPAEAISSGMLRTLVHLVELTLAPEDSVVLIDEFENSLGVNCMGPLTDFIQSRAPELQFIITSHHPYIINQIPKSHWKLVQRHGSTVRVTPASEIRALQGASAQDDFIRLINAPEFERGVS